MTIYDHMTSRRKSKPPKAVVKCQACEVSWRGYIDDDCWFCGEKHAVRYHTGLMKDAMVYE